MLGKPPEGSGDRLSLDGLVLVPGAVPDGAPLIREPDEANNFELPFGGFECLTGAVPVGCPLSGSP